MAEKHSCRWRRAADRQAEQARTQQAKLDATQAERDLLAVKVAELEHQLALATRQILGPKSERMPTPDEEARKHEGPAPTRGGHTNPEKQKRNAATKAAVSAEVVTHPVPAEERPCPSCGEDAIPIGEGDVSVEWEWVKGYFRKRLHVVEAAHERPGSHGGGRHDAPLETRAR